MRRLLAVGLNGLVMALVCLSTGCITSRDGQLPPITQWPPEAKSIKPSISMVVNGTAVLNGKAQDVTSTAYVQQWRALTVRAYQDSGIFSNVKEGAGESDLLAEINVIDQGDSSFVMGFLTGFTMGLVPSSSSDVFTMTTTLRDRNGKTISTINMQETRTTWMQLFLVFGMPFQSAENNLVYDLNRATIQEARGKGHL